MARRDCRGRRNSGRRGPKTPLDCNPQSRASCLCVDSLGGFSFEWHFPGCPMSLLPFEIGGTLFDVSGKALLGVFAGEEELLKFTLEAEGFGEGNFRAGDDGTLDASDGAGSFIGRAELPGVGEDVVPE